MSDTTNDEKIRLSEYRELRELRMIAAKYEERYFALHKDFVDKKNECKLLRVAISDAIENILSRGGDEKWPIIKRLRTAGNMAEPSNIPS